MSIIFLYFLLTFNVQGQADPTIVGKWEDAAHPEKKVEIQLQDGKYNGTSINEPNQLVFKDLEWSNTSKTYKGFVINPGNQDEIEVEIALKDDETFEFSVGAFIFKRKFQFRRI